MLRSNKNKAKTNADMIADIIISKIYTRHGGLSLKKNSQEVILTFSASVTPAAKSSFAHLRGSFETEDEQMWAWDGMKIECNWHVMICIPKQSLESGFGSRSVVLPQEAPKRHLPFAHKSASSYLRHRGRRCSPAESAAATANTGVFYRK